MEKKTSASEWRERLRPYTRFTDDDIAAAVSVASAVMRESTDPEARTPLNFLYGVTLDLLSKEQQSNEPKFTDQELNDLGVYLVVRKKIGEGAPFTSEQIAEDINMRRAGLR